jgi:hypothetical protein
MTRILITFIAFFAAPFAHAQVTVEVGKNYVPAVSRLQYSGPARRQYLAQRLLSRQARQDSF